MRRFSVEAAIQVARRLGVGLVVLSALSWAMTATPRTEAAIRGEPCLAPEDIKGLGARPQTSLHIQYLIPKYEETCPSGVDKMSYDPLGDEAAVEALVKRQSGKTAPTDAPYLIFATDLPLTSVEKYSAEVDLYHPFNPRTGAFVHHYPFYVSGVAIGYNLGFCETGQPLRLSARQLSLIYSGGITTWNNPLLVFGDPTRPDDDNPFLGTCNMAINVARRDDVAASTIILKDYLAQGNPAFYAYRLKELNTIWPQTLPPGCRGITDAGISTCLATPGTIGYALYQEAYDKSYNLAYVQNSSGAFIAPATTVWPAASRVTWPDQCVPASQSATVAPTQTDWSRTTLTTTTSGYPICAFGYMLSYARPSFYMGATPQELRTLVDYLTVSVRDDVQDGISSQHVSYITPNVRSIVRNGINNISDV